MRRSMLCLTVVALAALSGSAMASPSADGMRMPEAVALASEQPMPQLDVLLVSDARTAPEFATFNVAASPAALTDIARSHTVADLPSVAAADHLRKETSRRAPLSGRYAAGVISAGAAFALIAISRIHPEDS